jgi:hypothetical protein
MQLHNIHRSRENESVLLKKVTEANFFPASSGFLRRRVLISPKRQGILAENDLQLFLSQELFA